MKTDLAVVILTFNESLHIARALDSVKDIASEVFVIDSGSTDGTVRIATEYGSDKHPTATLADLDRAWKFAEGLARQLAPRPSRLGSAPSIRIPPQPDPR